MSVFVFTLAAATISAQGLLQTGVRSSDPMFGPDPAAPSAASGLWSAETAGCGGERRADLNAWPECAKPIRVDADHSVGTVALLSAARDGTQPPLRMLSTQFVLAPAWPGAPAIVQLEIPGLLDSSFVYAAVEPGERDPSGRFTSARLRPISCPGPGVAGVGTEREGCAADTPTGVHEAGRRTQDGPVLLLRRIAP